MKKIIAISVMCALLVGAAFAETTVGGKIHIGGQILNGDSDNNSYFGTGEMSPDWYNTTIAVNFGDATAGGKMSLHNKSPSFYDYFVWWRPIQQFRMQVGVNADGDFGTAKITGWGFTGEAKNSLGAIGEYSGPVFGLAHARTGFYGGTGETTNVAFSVFPIDGLTVNLWIPLKGENAPTTFLKTELNAVYKIEDIGDVTFSFQGNGFKYREADPDKAGSRVKDIEYADKVKAADEAIEKTGKGEAYYEKPSWWVTEQTGTPKFWLSFYLTALENMGIDLGLAYQLPLKYSYDKMTKVYDKDDWRYNYSYEQNYPFEIGLGYRLSLGDLTFKLRTAFSVGGSTKSTFEGVALKDLVEGKKDDDGNTIVASTINSGAGTIEYPTLTTKETKISVNILPSYKIGKMTAFLFAGIGIQATDSWEKTVGGVNIKEGIYYNNASNTVVSWFVNPYLHIPAGDGLRFQVGFQLYSDGLKSPYYKDGVRNFDSAKISWAIPFGFYTYF